MMAAAKPGRSGQSLKPVRFAVVPRLLDHIGLAMYSKATKAVAELVVNGYDADATIVHVRLSSDEIRIGDNGAGMNEMQIRKEYMVLGSDHKRRSPRTRRYGRLPIGNKGIGKLAGLGIAERMTVSTRQNGMEYTYVIDRRQLQKATRLDRAWCELSARPCPRQNSGTTVTLTKPFPHIKLDARELRGYIAREVPQGDDFAVFVNGKPCTRTHIPAKRRVPVQASGQLCGEVRGEVIVAKKALTTVAPGLVTTVRGRAVGPPSLFSLTRTRIFFYHSIMPLITGTVEVAGFDPEGDAEGVPLIKTDREGFNEDHPKFREYSDIMTDILVRVCREEQREHEQRRKAEVEAKLKNALKNVADDFNEFDKLERDQVRAPAKQTAAPLPTGSDTIFADSERPLQHQRSPAEETRTNPVGITDKRLREELRAAKGSGSIAVGNRRYKVTTRPLGVDDYECRIDDEAMVVNINSSHPAYDQAVAEKSLEIPLFRAIAAAFCCKETETAEQFYSRLDEMIRFQAARMRARRLKA